MYFKLSCPHCGKNLKVTEKHVGRKATCPYCKTSIVVPAPAADAPEEDVQVLIQSIDTSDAPSPARPAAAGDLPQASAAAGPGHSASSTSDVSMMWTGLTALGVTLAVILVMIPFRKFYLGELLLRAAGFRMRSCC